MSRIGMNFGMDSRAMRGFVVLAGLAALVLTTACSASRSRANRTRLLEAEIIDARQSNEQLRGQLADANSAQDRATTELQHERYVKQQLEDKLSNQNGQIADLTARSASAETNHEVATRRVTDLEKRVDKLLTARRAEREKAAALRAQLAQRPSRPMAAPAPFRNAGDDARLTAMKSDLKSAMAKAGIHMPVEIRTASSGRRGVAVVLPDTFKSGKATLAYNPTAVQAVVGLGSLVQAKYGGAAISVEGHTDSDPIRRSSWASNEELSLARAAEVRKLLTDTGIDAGNIQVAGLGASNPIERGSSARAKSRNRRVEIFIESR